MKDSAGKADKRKRTTFKTRKSLTGLGKRKKVDDDDDKADGIKELMHSLRVGTTELTFCYEKLLQARHFTFSVADYDGRCILLCWGNPSRLLAFTTFCWWRQRHSCGKGRESDLKNPLKEAVPVHISINGALIFSSLNHVNAVTGLVRV